MSNILAQCFLYVIIAACLALTMFCFARIVAYRRYLHYSPICDYSFPLKAAKRLSCRIENGIVRLPESVCELYTDITMEFCVKATLTGLIQDPSIQLVSGDCAVCEWFFERGAQGRRYITFRASALGACNVVKLASNKLKIVSSEVQVYLFFDDVSPDDRVLVVSPHPDDAEIAAFGLYSSATSCVVTITAGGSSDRYGKISGVFPGKTAALPSSFVCHVRARESLNIPSVSPRSNASSFNLGFPDGELLEMLRNAASTDAAESTTDELAAGKNTRAPLTVAAEAVAHDIRECPKHRTPRSSSWQDLRGELQAVFDAFMPTIIVIPHPLWDSHADHKASAIAALQAAEHLPPTTRIFMYVNHNEFSELWPFGPSWASSGLPPLQYANHGPGVACFSLNLNPSMRLEKLIALDSMLDIRELPMIPPLSTRCALRELASMLKGFVHGLGRPATSYLRRAVRTNEFFFVIHHEDVQSLLTTALPQCTGDSGYGTL